MSLEKNIAASYASQIYVTLVGIAVLPLYIKHLGAEAYGLVGFFAVVQSWFGLLDLGLTHTIARETARYHGGAVDAETYANSFRVLSYLFTSLATIGAAGIWLLSGGIAHSWLRLSEMSPGGVVEVLRIMGFCVAIRWLCGLYRGVLTGGERLIWLSGFNILVATFRFPAAFASMAVFGFTPRVFFLHQLAVVIVEAAVLFVKCRRLVPWRSSRMATVQRSFAAFKPLLGFSLLMALSSAIWIVTTQSDRLILSGILSLAEYGYYNVAVMIAGGVSLIIAPVSQVITPRMARLHAEGRHNEMIAVYRSMTRVTAAAAAVAAATLVVCAEPILWAWADDQNLTRHAAPVMQLYAVGNALLAVGAFPLYIQYARGSLFYHFVGHILIAIFLLPGIIYAARLFGGVGAGYAWVIVNVVYLLVWVAVVHSKLVPGLHFKWIMNDVVKVIAPIAGVGFLAAVFRFPLDGRLANAGYTLAVAFSLIAAALLAVRISGFKRYSA